MSDLTLEQIVERQKAVAAEYAQLTQQITDMQRAKRGEAIAQIRELMGQYGLTVADIAGGSRGGSGSKAAKTGAKVAPKYRHPETGETWSGRGLQPKWLKAALEGGAQLTDFAI